LTYLFIHRSKILKSVGSYCFFRDSENLQAIIASSRYLDFHSSSQMAKTSCLGTIFIRLRNSFAIFTVSALFTPYTNASSPFLKNRLEELRVSILAFSMRANLNFSEKFCFIPNFNEGSFFI